MGSSIGDLNVEMLNVLVQCWTDSLLYEEWTW